jgi:hypothetical protein
MCKAEIHREASSIAFLVCRRLTLNSKEDCLHRRLIRPWIGVLSAEEVVR